MRELGFATHPDVMNFVKSIIPADTAGSAMENYKGPSITIHAANGMVALNGGKNTKHSHPAFWCAIIISILIFATLNMKITAAQADSLSDLVGQVAQCEHKSPNTIHSELRHSYEYARYSNMDMIDYYRAKWKLNARRCD